jgi:hypothetical protein
MSEGVLSWWCLLCAVSALNIIAWSMSAVALDRRRSLIAPETFAVRRRLLWLSAVYVFGCAFRSALPVFDGHRLCLFNTFLSSALVGRTVATCAELCFAAQWAVMLRETSRATGSTFGRFAALAVVPLIAVAEVCSWYSVLTTSNIGHVAEESIWGLSGALLVAGMAAIWPRCTVSLRPLLLAWCIAGTAYVAFMFLVDVPMYWSRWIADSANGRHYMSIAQGVHDAAVRRIVSYRWQDWKSEITWMTLYFSVAVWLSIALIHAPERLAQASPRSPTR